MYFSLLKKYMNEFKNVIFCYWYELNWLLSENDVLLQNVIILFFDLLLLMNVLCLEKLIMFSYFVRTFSATLHS